MSALAPGQKKPAGQGALAEVLAEPGAQYDPAGATTMVHATGTAGPPAHRDPAGHLTPTADVVAGPPGQWDPAGAMQGAGAAAPPAQKDPAGQALHAVPDWKDPVGQETQAPVDASQPPEPHVELHSEHVATVPRLYLFLLQALASLAPPSQENPAGQGTGGAAPPAQVYPAGHRTLSSVPPAQVKPRGQATQVRVPLADEDPSLLPLPLLPVGCRARAVPAPVPVAVPVPPEVVDATSRYVPGGHEEGVGTFTATVMEPLAVPKVLVTVQSKVTARPASEPGAVYENVPGGMVPEAPAHVEPPVLVQENVNGPVPPELLTVNVAGVSTSTELGPDTVTPLGGSQSSATPVKGAVSILHSLLQA